MNTTAIDTTTPDEDALPRVGVRRIPNGYYVMVLPRPVHEFRVGMHMMHSRMEHGETAWRVPLQRRDELRRLLLYHYGVDGGLPDPATAPEGSPPRRIDFDVAAGPDWVDYPSHAIRLDDESPIEAVCRAISRASQTHVLVCRAAGSICRNDWITDDQYQLTLGETSGEIRGEMYVTIPCRRPMRIG